VSRQSPRAVCKLSSRMHTNVLFSQQTRPQNVLRSSAIQLCKLQVLYKYWTSASAINGCDSATIIALQLVHALHFCPSFSGPAFSAPTPSFMTRDVAPSSSSSQMQVSTPPSLALNYYRDHRVKSIAIKTHTAVNILIFLHLDIL